ncbi:MAG: hypothetical protein IJG50_02305 [Clostridia bacterium]|nr:hypothetical protein [Clostridia bacterium]
MDIAKQIIAVVILGWSIWYIAKPINVIKGGQFEKHLYKRPNRTRIIWAIRITGILGVGVAIFLFFSDYFLGLMN